MSEKKTKNKRAPKSFRAVLISAFTLFALFSFVLVLCVLTLCGVTGKALFCTLLVSAVILILAAVILALVLEKKLVAPFGVLRKAAKSISCGEYDAKIREKAAFREAHDTFCAFCEMSDIISEKEKERQSFIGTAAHDIRSPMTSIAGFVDGILDGTIPQEKQEHYLGIVSSEAHRLSRLVGTLLDITRIQSGQRKFKCESFDVCELLRLILISSENEISKKKLSVEFVPCFERCEVFSDRDAIHQVAYNIIHNAIKFSDEEGVLRISVEKQEDGKYLVKIYNTGKGIKKEELPYIFERFYRAQNGEKFDKSGTGLGLYIVKTILSALGENIYADSSENEFCEFTFTLGAAEGKE